MLRWHKLELSAGGLLLLALLWYWDGEGILPWALAAAGIHELGHYCAIRLCGGRVVRVRLTAIRAEMALSAARPLPPLRRLVCDLAGPAVNLIAALWAAHATDVLGGRAYLFAGLHLGLGLFNLLPLGRLDGGRALRDALEGLWSAQLGEHVAAFCEGVVLLALVLGGLALLWRRGNATLLITAIGLAALNWRERQPDRRSAR